MLEVASVMMALGAFRFGIGAGDYQSLRRTASYRWPQQDRVGRAPAAQYLGPGAQEVRLSGVVYPHFKGGLRQVEAMRALAGLGRPMMLTDGLGFVFDLWCIVSLSETRSVLMRDGTPRQIDFEVGLQSYGRDAA